VLPSGESYYNELPAPETKQIGCRLPAP